MTKRERFKRPAVDRAEPSRSFTGVFGGAADSERRAPHAGNGAARSGDDPDTAYDAVNNAYRVIDEYMRQGQKLAEGFWLPATTRGNGTVSDFSRVLERFFRSAGDMGMAWIEMMSELSRPTRSDAAPQGTAGPFSFDEPDERIESEPMNERSLPFTIVVSSSKRVRVSVDTFGSLVDVDVSPLISTDRTLPPVAAVDIEVESVTSRPTLTVTVPDDQPKGTYHGVLLDRTTGRPGGTIMLVVE